MGINPNNNFSVNLTNNTFVVSVDDVKGTVTIDPKDSYTIDSFTNALQNAADSPAMIQSQQVARPSPAP